MEEKIKNFDRTIEQMMNENSVAPPFGAWNRIAAELGGEALPIAASAPASLIPKRAAVILVAGVLLIGSSLVTAYFLNSNSDKEQITENVIPAAELTPEITPEQNVVPVTEKNEIAAPVAVKRTELRVSKPVTSPTVKEETLSLASKEPGLENSSEVAVPNQLIASNTGGMNETYYFPPVDVNTSENKSNEAATTTAQIISLTAEEKIAEKKTKVSTSGKSERKVKFKKRKTKDFRFGNVNRTKQNKSR